MKPHRAPSYAFAALLTMILAQPFDAEARLIRVDAGSGNYSNSGGAWVDPETPLGGAPFLAGTLPFSINFGGGAVNSFCMFANGSVGFAANCAAVPADALLQPLFANWTINPGTTRVFEEGSATFTEGRLARQPPIPPDPNDAPFAVRFHWNEVGCDTCNGVLYSFQAILIDMGNGDFDLELNYDDIPAGVGIAGFQLGTNQYSFAGPFLSATDYDFRFRIGVLVNGNAVPVPGTLALAAAALAALSFARRQRR